ncbi:hypothetical protein L1887_02671 [Cichorium endivia]|nr:hypothetical protein L1887_02671 [Cichorium endivia]
MLKDPALSTARAKLIKLMSLTRIAPVMKARSLTSDVLKARVLAEAGGFVRAILCLERRLQFLELVTMILEYEENHTQNFSESETPIGKRYTKIIDEPTNHRWLFERSRRTSICHIRQCIGEGKGWSQGSTFNSIC